MNPCHPSKSYLALSPSSFRQPQASTSLLARRPSFTLKQIKMVVREYSIDFLGGDKGVALLIEPSYVPRKPTITGGKVQRGEHGSRLTINEWPDEFLRNLYFLKLNHGKKGLKGCKEAVSKAVALRNATKGAVDKNVAEALPADIINAARILKHGSTKHCVVKLLREQAPAAQPAQSGQASSHHSSQTQQNSKAYDDATDDFPIENGLFYFELLGGNNSVDGLIAQPYRPSREILEWDPELLRQMYILDAKHNGRNIRPAAGRRCRRLCNGDKPRRTQSIVESPMCFLMTLSTLA